MEVSKKDWKFVPASTKFWEMEKRIKRDKKHPGVLIELDKHNMPFDLVRLLNLDVITRADLEEFSDDLKETVLFLQDRLGSHQVSNVKALGLN